MIKSDLREAGYAEDTKHQKSLPITAIWVFSALAMIVLVFVFAVLSGMWKSSGNDFVDFLDDMAFLLSRVLRNWVYAVYLILWALIFLTLYFMTKRDLQRQKPDLPPKISKRQNKYILPAVLAVLMLAALLYILIFISVVPVGDSNRVLGSDGFEAVGGLDFFYYVILYEFIYLAAKFVATRFVCHNKKGSIKFRLLKGNAMPVCSNQEAVSLWHIIVSYLFPYVFVYSVLFGLCGSASAQSAAFLIHQTIAAIFMSIFLSFDLTLVLYAVYMKIRYKMDYISIDRHIYEVTLFKRSCGGVG
jgi:hypothetical protein